MRSFYFSLCILLLVYGNNSYGSEAGMPQLNPEFWVAQVFWLIIIFSSLYLIVWKIFLPKITYGIENRKSKIVNDLNEAQNLKESAEKKLSEYNKIIENSKAEAKKIVDDARKKLDKDIENKKKKFSEEIEKDLEAVEKEIKDLRKSSVENINKIASEVSIDIIKQLIGTEINKSNVSAIVDGIARKKIEKQI